MFWLEWYNIVTTRGWLALCDSQCDGRPCWPVVLPDVPCYLHYRMLELEMEMGCDGMGLCLDQQSELGASQPESIQSFCLRQSTLDDLHEKLRRILGGNMLVCGTCSMLDGP